MSNLISFFSEWKSWVKCLLRQWNDRLMQIYWFYKALNHELNFQTVNIAIGMFFGKQNATLYLKTQKSHLAVCMVCNPLNKRPKGMQYALHNRTWSTLSTAGVPWKRHCARFRKKTIASVQKPGCFSAVANRRTCNAARGGSILRPIVPLFLDHVPSRSHFPAYSAGNGKMGRWEENTLWFKFSRTGRVPAKPAISACSQAEVPGEHAAVQPAARPVNSALAAYVREIQIFARWTVGWCAAEEQFRIVFCLN